VKEEALSHRLGVYLQELFPDHIVDCEYNKYGEAGYKKMGLGKGIRPDIIAHHRGLQDHNLFVVEVKKKSSPSAWDEKKLKRLTSNRGIKYKYNYTFGLFVGFFTRGGSKTANVIWYQRGKPRSPGELILPLSES
jgi:hypothetical protein